YPYPPIYYPPYSGVVAASAISFGVGFAIGAIASNGWNNWGWNCGWGHNNIQINNNFINNNRFNRTNGGNGNAWVHNPAHRGGVPYRNANVANRFNGNRVNPNNRPSVAQTQQRLTQAGNNFRGGQIGQGNFKPGGGQIGQGNFKPGGGQI